MPTSPNITLTATLLDYSGNTIGTTTQPAWVRIALCGFGATLPVVSSCGGNLAKVSSWALDIPFTGTALSIPLYGNDQIAPAGTYYAISVLDTNKNVVQTGMYSFTGTQTIDLSCATQIVPPSPAQLFNIVFVELGGTAPGTVFTLPSPALGGAILGFFYRGVFYPAVGNYTLVGQTLTTTFVCTAVPYALYIQALG